MSDKPLIDPERAGLWAAAAFILALLALGVGAVAIQRTSVTFGMSQAEFLALNKKVNELESRQAASAGQAVTASAPMAEAKK